MSSEILKFVLENANRFGATDFLLLFAILGMLVGSGWWVIHWIYTNALGKQDVVIAQQDKLIELKEKTIAEHERARTALAVGVEELKRALADQKAVSDTLENQSAQLRIEHQEVVSALNRLSREVRLLAVSVLVLRKWTLYIQIFANFRTQLWVYTKMLEIYDEHDLDNDTGQAIFERLEKLELQAFDRLAFATDMVQIDKSKVVVAESLPKKLDELWDDAPFQGELEVLRSDFDAEFKSFASRHPDEIKVP